MASPVKAGRRAALMPLAACLLGACATTPGGQRLAERDPLEGANRVVFAFNEGVDTVVLRPVTHVYRAVVPKPAQQGVSNAFVNVTEPFSFINALLQGKVAQAGRTFARFAINTTLGIGGLFDHATGMGLPREPEDFGQTLAVWGVNAGPYVVLPLLGPSTFRDTVGRGIEFAGGDPYRLAVREANLSTTEEYALTGLEIIDTRSYLMDTADVLLKGSADKYATTRAAYLQFRESLVHDGFVPDDYDETMSDASLAPADGHSDPATAPDTAPVAEAAPES